MNETKDYLSKELTNKIFELEKEVAALRRALKSHGEIVELNAKLVLENQELKIKNELSQEL